MHQLPGICELSGKKVSEGQIVAVVVGRRIDFLGLTEKGCRLGDFSGTDVKLTQVVVGVEVSRFELNCLPEFHSRQFHLSQAHQVGRQVGSGGRGIRFQAYRILQVRAGFRVLRLRGIDQAQEFMDFEALREPRAPGSPAVGRLRGNGLIHIAPRPPGSHAPGAGF